MRYSTTTRVPVKYRKLASEAVKPQDLYAYPLYSTVTVPGTCIMPVPSLHCVCIHTPGVLEYSCSLVIRCHLITRPQTSRKRHIILLYQIDHLYAPKISQSVILSRCCSVEASSLMDSLESFGQLSTAAKEWKPSSAAAKPVSDRQSSFATDRTSSYDSTSGSGSGAGPNYGGAPLLPAVPQSPIPQMSPIRAGGLLPSPPGRTAWQQHHKQEYEGIHSGLSGLSNPYARAESWGTSPVSSENPTAWPDGEFFLFIARFRFMSFVSEVLTNSWKD